MGAEFLSIYRTSTLRTLFYNQTGLRPKDIIFLHNDFQSLKFGLRTKNSSYILTPIPLNPTPDNFLRPNKVFSATEMLGAMSFNFFKNM